MLFPWRFPTCSNVGDFETRRNRGSDLFNLILWLEKLDPRIFKGLAQGNLDLDLGETKPNSQWIFLSWPLYFMSKGIFEDAQGAQWTCNTLESAWCVVGMMKIWWKRTFVSLLLRTLPSEFRRKNTGHKVFFVIRSLQGFKYNFGTLSACTETVVRTTAVIINVPACLQSAMNLKSTNTVLGTGPGLVSSI